MLPSRIAVVSASMKFNGMHEDAMFLYHMLSDYGCDTTFYQCVDRHQKNAFSTYGNSLLGSNVFPSLLETAFNRFYTFPREIGRLTENIVIVGEQTLLNTVGRRNGIVMRVLDTLRLGSVDRNIPSHLSAKLATIIWHNTIARKISAAERLLVPSEFVRHEVISLGADPDRVSVVYSAIADNARESQSVQKRRSLSHDLIRFLYIAADRPHKNVKFFIDLAQELNGLRPGQFEFHLLSNLDSKTNWYLQSKAIRNFHIHSNVANVSSLYESCDVLLHPSLYEGFGRPVAEAMSHGLAVVASDVGPLPEITGGAAIMCPPNDMRAWIDGALRATSPDSYASFSGKSIANSVRFSPEAVSGQLIDALSKVKV